MDSVAITAASTTLVIGQTESLAATATAAGHAVSGATVTWSSSDPSVASVDANGLVVAIKGGTTQIVATAAGKSDAVQVTVNNPPPTIGSLIPIAFIVGDSAPILTVNGSGFLPSSTVLWNGATRHTTYGSATQLSAALLVEDLLVAGTAQVAVANVPPGGGASAAVSFLVANPPPVVTRFAPTGAVVAGAPFTLDLIGTGFVAGSTLQWNGSPRQTTFVSPTELAASISTSDLAAVGSVPIAVVTPAPGGGASATINYPISPTPNPRAVTTSITPNAAAAFDPSFTLTATGSGYLTGAIAYWNGFPLVTSVVNPQTVTAVVPTFELLQGGTAAIAVLNPAPGGGGSATLPLAVTSPVPHLDSIVPATLSAGLPGAMVNLFGTNIVGTATALWNGASRVTGHGAPGAGFAAMFLTTADLANPGTAMISLSNPPPGGGSSAPLPLVITLPGAPVLSHLTPASTAADQDSIQVDVLGSGFVARSIVSWNGSARPTTFVTSEDLRVTFSAADLSVPIEAQVAVTTSAPGGGGSSTFPFRVIAAVPAITAVLPARIPSTTSAIDVTVNGTGFAPTATALWRGSQRNLTFVSPSQVIVHLHAGDASTTGVVHVAITNPPPGGGTSPQFDVTVLPVPRITSLSPSTVIATSVAFNLTVTGFNFVANSAVRWNGSNRTTNFISSTQLLAVIPATDIATPGAGLVSVFNPTDSVESPAITLPVTPVNAPLIHLVTSIAAPSLAHDSYVRDGLLFAEFWNDGVWIFDVGNGMKGGSPANPQLISKIVTADNGVPSPSVHNAWWFNNPVSGEKRYLFVGQEGPGIVGTNSFGDIHVVDVSDLAHPAEVGFIHIPGAGTHNFWMDESRQVLYAAYYNGGVIEVDVSGTLSGDLSGRITHQVQPGGPGNTYVWGVMLAANTLYATDMLSGFWALDPVTLATKGGGNNVPERYSSDQWVVGSYAYSGTWAGVPRPGTSAIGNAIKIWSLDAGGIPTLADSLVIPGVPVISDVTATPDGKALVFTTESGNGAAGLYVYSLANPVKPSFTAFYPVLAGLHTGTVAVINGRTYLFGAHDPSPAQMDIYDITDVVH